MAVETPVAQRTVLVVEDDAAVRRGLVDALGCGGYRVLEAERGDEALKTALAADCDLVLLDVILPGLDGFEVLEQLRIARPALPVIMVTARGAESDRIQGLRTGADDYVVKPFSALEVLARIEAVLRRSAERPQRAARLEFDGRRIDLERCEVALGDGGSRALSEKEVQLLGYLAACQGRPISRQELLQRVWGLDPRGVTTRTIDMHVARLREKLDDHDEGRRMIVTVRARGYMLAPEVRVEAP
jgi:DNA-binding response OmpR family regulator